jgi:hypothetical protein
MHAWLIVEVRSRPCLLVRARMQEQRNRHGWRCELVWVWGECRWVRRGMVTSGLLHASARACRPEAHARNQSTTPRGACRQDPSTHAAEWRRARHHEIEAGQMTSHVCRPVPMAHGLPTYHTPQVYRIRMCHLSYKLPYEGVHVLWFINVLNYFRTRCIVTPLNIYSYRYV